MLTLYHRTTPENARFVLVNGFTDTTDTYLTSAEHTGVWLSDRALSSADTPGIGPILLRAELSATEDEIAQYEWTEDLKSYREWLIPADVLNRIAKIDVDVPEDEGDPAGGDHEQLENMRALGWMTRAALRAEGRGFNRERVATACLMTAAKWAGSSSNPKAYAEAFRFMAEAIEHGRVSLDDDGEAWIVSYALRDEPE